MDAGGGNNAVRQAMTCVGGKEYPASGALVACERVQGLRHGGCNSVCLRQQAACLLARSQLAAAAALVGGGCCLAANSAPLSAAIRVGSTGRCRESSATEVERCGLGLEVDLWAVQGLNIVSWAIMAALGAGRGSSRLGRSSEGVWPLSRRRCWREWADLGGGYCRRALMGPPGRDRGNKDVVAVKFLVRCCRIQTRLQIISGCNKART